jgi:hypothetical protein
MKKTLFLLAFLPLLLSAAPPSGSTGLPVTFYATNAAVGATTVETAVTLNKARGVGATSSAASFVIGTSANAGTRYHITQITFATLGNAVATAQNTVFNLRVNTAGAVTTSSTPIVVSARCATAATASAYDRISLPVSIDLDGDGTAQFGLTVNATYTTNAPTVDVLIQGYEYHF